MSPFLYVVLPRVGIRQYDGPIPHTRSLLKWGNLISRPTESSVRQSILFLGTRIKDYTKQLTTGRVFMEQLPVPPLVKNTPFVKPKVSFPC